MNVAQKFNQAQAIEAESAARRGNPDISNTAARYVAKAMTRVHPRQRAELLAAMIDVAGDALAHIEGVRA